MTLDYPFDSIPAQGEPTPVAEGVWWLRMPLPFSLDHINLYLLRDGDGWTIVDTGIRGPEVLEHWQRVLGEFMNGAPVNRVIATHMHPDHVGQAGWLTRHCGVELWMTRTEFLSCRVLAGDGPSDVPEDALRFYRQCGFDELPFTTRPFYRGDPSWVLPVLGNYYRLRDRLERAVCAGFCLLSGVVGAMGGLAAPLHCQRLAACAGRFGGRLPVFRFVSGRDRLPRPR